MATVNLEGTPVPLAGTFPVVGDVVPSFTLLGVDLKPFTSTELHGARVLLNIFPSVDTGVCATSVREFNARVASLENVEVVCVSADLPFAQRRFSVAENTENVRMGSTFNNSAFLRRFGVEIAEGTFAGLAARSVIVYDETDRVVYTELVPEIGTEPNYDNAIESLTST